MGSGADEQRRTVASDKTGQAVEQASITASPPIPPVVRWRESAHEYDFGPADSDPDLPQRRPWRGSAHEYDFGGEW